MATPSPNPVLLNAYRAQLCTLADIKEIGAAAFKRITDGAGESKVNVSWGQAGKNFSFLSDLSATECLNAASYAIQIINDETNDVMSMVEVPRFYSV
jgi:hypothetical protein